MTVALFFVGLAVICFIAYLIATKYPQDNLTPEQRAQKLVSEKYSKDMSRFAAIREAKASEARTAAASQLNREAEEVTQFVVAEFDASALYVRKKHEIENLHARLEEARSLEKEQNAYEIEKIKQELLIIAKAAEAGMTVEGYQEFMAKKALLELEIKAQLEARKTDVQLELEKHRGFKQIDHEAEERSARLDAEMADLKNMMPYHEYEVLQGRLSQAYFQLDATKKTDDSEIKTRELDRINSLIDGVEKDIKNRKAELIRKR